MISNHKLTDGRTVWLDAFFQGATYAGLLEGKPNAEVNMMILRDRWPSSDLWGRKKWLGGREKRATELLGEVEYMKNLAAPLPRIRRVGLFISTDPVVGGKGDASSLACVWFQDEDLPYLNERNVASLSEVDWNKFAEDFGW